MNNIILVIKREYLSRVRKKSFIIMTILGPILFAAVMFIPAWLAVKGGDEKSVLVIDESQQFSAVFTTDEKTKFHYNDVTEFDQAKQKIINGQYDGLLVIPNSDIDSLNDVSFYSSSNPSLSMLGDIRNKIKSEVEELKLKRSGLNQEVLDKLKAQISVDSINLSDQGVEKKGSSVGASVVGYIAGFLIYIFIFIYGAMCMRGVIEEKNSRIVEVILASVRPFDLMMGKVLGIASVGLSQFILWIMLTFGIVIIGGIALGAPGSSDMAMASSGGADNPFIDILMAAEAINIPLVIISFLFYFVSGYLFYGALFAAVGSAVDSDADAQQFMFPVSMPLILSIVLLGAVLNDPNGTLAFWLSMIPFTAPVVMMMRVSFGVPLWELGLSMMLMVAGFIFVIWFAGRIYRVGILMHGTKVNYKVLAKWFMTNQ